uniref:Uncharacterized protein n=1 Tax=Nelumbo nucifera TaxID=4432 RepID=A0A822Y6G7_NELNU|nr:TPA_asm: hypothetical protein HUJ06_026652 [Nelumbo nucifera]
MMREVWEHLYNLNKAFRLSIFSNLVSITLLLPWSDKCDLEMAI